MPILTIPKKQSLKLSLLRLRKAALAVQISRGKGEAVLSEVVTLRGTPSSNKARRKRRARSSPPRQALRDASPSEFCQWRMASISEAPLWQARALSIRRDDSSDYSLERSSIQKGLDSCPPHISKDEKRREDSVEDIPFCFAKKIILVMDKLDRHNISFLDNTLPKEHTLGESSIHEQEIQITQEGTTLYVDASNLGRRYLVISSLSE